MRLSPMQISSVPTVSEARVCHCYTATLHFDMTIHNGTHYTPCDMLDKKRRHSHLLSHLFNKIRIIDSCRQSIVFDLLFTKVGNHRYSNLKVIADNTFLWQNPMARKNFQTIYFYFCLHRVCFNLQQS